MTNIIYLFLENAKIRLHNQNVKPGEKIRRIIVWPYYERMGDLLKLSGAMGSDDDGSQSQTYVESMDNSNTIDMEVEEEEEEGEDDEYDCQEDDESAPGAAVNRAIRNLLQTNRDPVLILEDINPRPVKIDLDNDEDKEIVSSKHFLPIFYFKNRTLSETRFSVFVQFSD